MLSERTVRYVAAVEGGGAAGLAEYSQTKAVWSETDGEAQLPFGY
ncbi:MAG: hypothetical protein WA892_05275 [Ornithinimicrobium sp.]